MDRMVAKTGKVLPASAGMIPIRNLLNIYTLCAPRICGDDPLLIRNHRACRMCSPHLRG